MQLNSPTQIGASYADGLVKTTFLKSLWNPTYLLDINYILYLYSKEEQLHKVDPFSEVKLCSQCIV